MGNLIVPGQEDKFEGHVPEEVYAAVAKAIEMGEVGRLAAAGLSLQEHRTKTLGAELIKLAMVIRRNLDSADQFDILMATAYRSGDMEASIRNFAARAEAGTLIKPNSSDYSHRKEALAKGNLSDHASRAERRRWEALQRKRAKRANKIEHRLR